jgi:NitT/TauT family transport system substrate-binding protein
MSSDGKPIDARLGMDESGLGMPGMEVAGSAAMPAMDLRATAGSPTAPDSAPRVPQVAEFVRYSGWPELKEAMISGRLKAAMLLAPMAMDLADKGIPVKVVALGHRSGAVIMVGTNSPYRSFADLRGKRVAIPSRFAVDHIFVRKLLKREGMTIDDIQVIEMPPPDMPAALLAGAVEAYATGEPFGAKSEMAGYARVLFMTKNEWPSYICCVLVVQDALIKSNPELVQTLVNNVMSAGHWLDANPEHRTVAANIAADKTMFNQAVALIRWVMERPADRVTYGDLNMIESEFDTLMNLSLEAGIISHPIPFQTYSDDSFMRNFRTVDIQYSGTYK